MRASSMRYKARVLGHQHCCCAALLQMFAKARRRISDFGICAWVQGGKSQEWFDAAEVTRRGRRRISKVLVRLWDELHR